MTRSNFTPTEIEKLRKQVAIKKAELSILENKLEKMENDLE